MNTDGAVVGAIAGRIDPDALVAELFASEARSLVRLAGIFCDDRNAAEDLVQEAFIRLHRSAASIRDVSRAPAFLRSIVINLARDENRRGLVSLRHRSAAESSRVAPVTPEDHVEDEEMLAAIRLLPDRQRACIVLRYYLTLTESETAETLGISKNSVKTHCRRALATLETAARDAR